MHGPGTGAESFGGIRVLARELADTPSDGGFEVAYCTPFLDVRRGVMKPEAAHETPRGSTTPSAGSSVNGTGCALRWCHVYGDRNEISC